MIATALAGMFFVASRGTRSVTWKALDTNGVSLPLKPTLLRLSTRRLGVTGMYIAPDWPGTK